VEWVIIIGNEEALSTTLFEDAVDYVALGHLHKPQKVGTVYNVEFRQRQIANGCLCLESDQL
jgi:hypothetical protein